MKFSILVLALLASLPVLADQGWQCDQKTPGKFGLSFQFKVFDQPLEGSYVLKIWRLVGDKSAYSGGFRADKKESGGKTEITHGKDIKLVIAGNDSMLVYWNKFKDMPLTCQHKDIGNRDEFKVK